MRLSIIVPVYNMAADNKLKFCLDSLLNQNLDDYEIIAVDDCSTDNSADILREYEKEYAPKITAVFSEKNGHQGAAKNKGLLRASGEWIGFIDSDDWASPDMYGKLLKRAEETGADVVGCDFSLVYDHTYDVGTVVPNNRDDQIGQLDTARRKSLILDGGSLCLKIYKRERILRDKLFFPENIFYEDNAVGNSYLVMANHFEYVKEPLYYYYQHNTSTVHTVTKVRCKDRMDAGVLMLEDAKARGYYEELKEEIDYKFIILYYTNTLFSYVREGKHIDVKFVKNIGEGLLKYVPDFRSNKYFIERISAEEKKMADLHLKHPMLFIVYYRALWAYRKLRSK